MSEMRRGRRLRDIPQQMNGMGATVPQYNRDMQGMTYQATPGTMPAEEQSAVRNADEERNYQRGQRQAAQSIAEAARGMQGMPEQGAQVIGKEEIKKAMRTLQEYKEGKRTVDERIVKAQQWWKLRNWEMIQAERGTEGATVKKSATAWLWNCVVGKHADCMDAYPEPVILPRMREDKAEAQMLSDIVPVVLNLNHYEDTYSDCNWQLLQEGTQCSYVGWDKDKLGGMGDIAIKKTNVLQLFWEPGIEDIQDSENLFFVRLENNSTLEEQYPQLKGKLGNAILIAKEYRHDDKIDTTKKSVVVDWYYHRWAGTRKILHFCQFVNEEVLFSTENNPKDYPEGLYWDGDYPFVMEPLYKVAGSPAGYGYYDIGKDAQIDIDTINQAMVQNAVVTSTPRYFVQGDGNINEAEFANWSTPFVHSQGTLGDQSIKPIEANGIQGNALSLLDRKIEELKYVTGNTDVNNGGTPSGVTAASAIAALQEISGRSSKDTNRGNYRAYNKIVNMVIERIRQFYDMPRQFMIIGPDGQQRFVEYTNAHLQEQQLVGGMGLPNGVRKPVFDIDVRAQRESAYTKMSQNELAVQFWNMGVFAPQMTDQAIMLLDMMDFKGKEELRQKIQEQGTLQEALMQVAQIAMALAQKYSAQEPGVAERLGAVMQGMMADAGLQGMTGAAPEGGLPEAEDAASTGKPSNENALVRRARDQVHNSVSPQ